MRICRSLPCYDSRGSCAAEHELALKQMESTLAAELQEQEERAQRRLLERRQRLQQKRQEAEAQKQKAIEQAKAELEAKIAAEAKQVRTLVMLGRRRFSHCPQAC